MVMKAGGLGLSMVMVRGICVRGNKRAVHSCSQDHEAWPVVDFLCTEFAVMSMRQTENDSCKPRQQPSRGQSSK